MSLKIETTSLNDLHEGHSSFDAMKDGIPNEFKEEIKERSNDDNQVSSSLFLNTERKHDLNLSSRQTHNLKDKDLGVRNKLMNVDDEEETLALRHWYQNTSLVLRTHNNRCKKYLRKLFRVRHVILVTIVNQRQKHHSTKNILFHCFNECPNKLTDNNNNNIANKHYAI